MFPIHSAHFEKLGIFLYNFWITYLLMIHSPNVFTEIEFWICSNFLTNQIVLTKETIKKFKISWNYRIRNSFFCENIMMRCSHILNCRPPWFYEKYWCPFTGQKNRQNAPLWVGGGWCSTWWTGLMGCLALGL